MPNLDNIINETARKEGISLNNLINQAAAKEGINLVPEETAKEAEKGAQIPVQTFETDTVPSYEEEQLKQRGVNSLKDLTAQVDNLDKGKLDKMQQEADAQQAYQKQLEDRGFWTNFKEGATSAWHSASSGGNEFIGNTLGFVASALERAGLQNPVPEYVGKAFRYASDETLKAAEQSKRWAGEHEYAGAGGDWGAVLPQTLELSAVLMANAITGGGTGIAAGVSRAAAAGMPWYLAGQAAGGAQQDYKEYWGSKGKPVDDGELLMVGAVGGATEYFAEKIGLDRLMGRGSNYLSKWLLRKNPEVVDNIIRGIAQQNPNLYKKLANSGFKFGMNAASEAGEEVATEGANATFEMFYKWAGGEKEDAEAVLGTIGYRMMEAAKGGAMMSAFLSPAQSGATRIRDWQRRQAQGMHMVTDNQNRTFEIIGEEGETLHVMDVNGIETTIKRDEVQADIRLSNEEYDLLLDAYKTGKNFEQHEQAHLMKNTQTGRLEMARDTRLDEDEEGGYFVHSRDESTGMATVTDVATGNKMMIPIAYIDPESIREMSVEDYVKAQGDPNAAIEPQPDQITNGEMVAGNGFVGVVTDSMPDGSMSVQTQDGQFITTTAQEVKRAKEFVGGLIGVDTGNGWEIGDPTPDREAADKTAATLSQAYPMLTFTIDEIPGADATTPTTFKITATENEQAQEQAPQEQQAPTSVSEVLQQAEAGVIPEPEAPRLSYNGKAIPKAFAKAKIAKATSREDLSALDTNDAEVMGWIEEKFPTPVPAYSFAGEPVSREEALNIIEAMDEDDLQDLQIENDEELATMVLAKFDRLPEVEKVEQAAQVAPVVEPAAQAEPIVEPVVEPAAQAEPIVEPVVEQQVAQPVGELLENKVVNNQVAREEAKVDTEPTEAQKEAGNYKKGHIQVQGLDITIEQPKGSVRKGTDEDGNAWESEMHNTYGYFKRTEGNDGDHVDVFIGDNPTSGRVFVVDQVNPKTGEFDEHKVMLGFNSQEEAEQAYLSNYEEGWQGLGAITEMDVDAFKTWVKDETKTTKPAKEVEPLDYDNAKKAVLDQFGGMYQAVAESSPEAIAASVPGVSPEMATQIHQEIKAEFEATKERMAANDSPFGWQQEVVQEGDDVSKVKELIESIEGVDMPQPIKGIEAFRQEFKEPVKTPINTIEVTDNVYLKIANKGRNQISGAVRVTLENPDFMIQDVDGSILFVKVFKNSDGSKNANVVGVSREGVEYDYLASFHKKTGNNLLNKIKNGAKLLQVPKNPTYGEIPQSNLTPLSLGKDTEINSENKIPDEEPVGELLERKSQERKRAKKATKPQEPAQEPVQESKAYGSDNKVVSADRAAELTKLLRAKLGNLNTGIDPELLALGVELAAFHVEAGARKFSDFCKRMVGDIGDGIKPYLKSVYNAVRDFPGMEAYEATMDEYAAVRGADIDQLLKEEPQTLDNEQKKPELESNVESKQENDGINSTQLRRDVSGTPGGDQTGDVAQDGERGTRRTDKDTRSQGSDGQETGSKVSGAGLSGGRSTGAGERGTVPTGGRSEQQPNGDDSQRKDIQPVGEQRKNQRNNVINEGDNIIPRGDVAKIKANLEAIRIAKQLEENGKVASPAQMEALRRYTGWGGLSQAFKPTDPHYAAVKEALTPSEYESARKSTTTAFYTPIDKVRVIWRMAEKLGFKGGNVLDPSGGTGHFFGVMPEGLRGATNLRGVELDQISGLIYKALYPDAHIEIGGYEDAQVANNSQDLIMTNVPFGDFKLHDSAEKALSSRFKIHDFFIAKSVKKLKPGGIGIFITTSSTMDGSQALREWLGQEGNADVIDAFRLNSDTFKQGAGTEATSDIIIIRKRDEKGKSPHAKDVMGTKVLREATYTINEYNRNTFRDEAVEKKAQMTVNSFFAENPDKMGGEMKFGMEGGNELRKTEQRCAPVKGIDQDALLEDFIEQLPANLHDATGGAVETVMNDTGAKEGGLVVKDGKVMIVSNSTLVDPGWNSNKVNGKSKAEAVQQYNRVKDALNTLMNEELNDGANIEALRKELNKAYDSFVKSFGTLNNNTKISFLKDDVDFPSIAAIENIVDAPKADLSIPRAKRQKVVKAKIFSERMLGVSPELKAETIEDAFVASNYKHGHLDMDYAAGLLGMKVEEFKAQALKEGVAFIDPATGVLVHKSDYLSGNVVAKLKEAKESNEDRAYDANIRALEKVLPMPIAMPVINLTLGSSWIPTNVYEKFFQEVFGVTAEITRTNADKYLAKQSNTHNAKNQSIEGLKASDMALMAMNNSRATVTYKNADGQTVVDKEATMAAQGKQNELRELFEEWVKREGQPFRSELETIYNETFRAVVNKDESVDHIVRFPGASVHSNLLRTHQKKAVLRALHKSTLFAHEVGTGKTMALITTAMEMRRLGLAKKPAIVVQRSTYKQFVNEIKKLYPNAKVLAPSAKDLTRAEREKLFAKIAYNDWDIVIMYHGYLDGIPDDPDRVRQYIQERIEEKLEILQQVKDSKAEGFNIAASRLEREIESLQEQMYSQDPSAKKGKSVKQEEKSKSRAEAKAKKLMDRRTDNTLTFESLGIDALLIDEAHQYKKLGFNTSLQKIKGIDTGASQRAQSALLKTRYIMERNNGRNVVFATGTPISNTTAELWTFLRYLMPKEELNRLGMGNFDAFVNNFGEVEEEYEFTASGQYKLTERFAKYGNLPELKTIFRQVAHIALTKEIPDLEAGVGVPRMKDNKETQVVIPQTPVLKGVMKSIKQKIEAWEKLPGKEKRAQSHIPIVMFGLAKQAAIDVRLVDSALPDDPASKLNKAVDLCVEQLEQSKGYKGTVAIFSDSKQSRDKKFNVFEDIKRKLVARGYAADEIAIIDDYNTDDKKEKLFEKVNAGEIRVVLGTTEKLGVGVNIQERLKCLIHMDAPIRPSDYQQRNGRIIRQGNIHVDMDIPVEVIQIGVEKTLDVTGYQRLAIKEAFVKQIMTEDDGTRTMEEEDMDGASGNFTEMMARVSGSQTALLWASTGRELTKLLNAQKYHAQNVSYMAAKMRANEARIPATEQQIEAEQREHDAMVKLFGDNKMTSIEMGKKKSTNPEEFEEFINTHIAKHINEAVEQFREKVYETTSKLSIPIKVNGVECNVVTIFEKSFGLEGQGVRINKHVTLYSKDGKFKEMPLGANPRRIISEIGDLLSKEKHQYNIEGFKESIERAKSENEVYAKEINRPFGKEAKIKELEEQLESLEGKMKEELSAIEKEDADVAVIELADITEEGAKVEEVQEEAKEENNEQETEEEEETPKEDAPIQDAAIQGAAGLVEMGEIRHTKTGKMLPAVKVSGRVSSEVFANMKKLAQEIDPGKGGGYYSTFAKRFLFSSSEKAAAFAERVNGKGESYSLVDEGQYKDSAERKAEVSKIVEELQKSTEGSLPTVVVQNAEELISQLEADNEVFRAEAVRRQLEAAKEKGKRIGIKGMMIGNRTYIVAETHRNEQEVVETWIHENVAHFGLRFLFKDAEGGKAKLNNLMLEIARLVTPEQMAQTIGKAYDMDNMKPEALADEYVAHIAEKVLGREDLTRVERSVWEKIRDYFADLLKAFTGDKIHFESKQAMDDYIVKLLKASASKVANEVYEAKEKVWNEETQTVEKKVIPRFHLFQGVIDKKTRLKIGAEYQFRRKGTVGELIAAKKPINKAQHDRYAEAARRAEVQFGVEIITVSNASGLPQHIQDQIQPGKEHLVGGCYDAENDVVYVVTNNLLSEDHLKAVILHEVVGHRGLRAVLGEKLETVLNEVYNSMNEADKALFAELYGTDDPLLIAEEYIARVADNRYERPNILVRVVSKVRELLRELFDIEYSYNDVLSLIARSEDFYKYNPKPNPMKYGTPGEYFEALNRWRNYNEDGVTAVRSPLFRLNNGSSAELSERGDKVRGVLQDRMLQVKRLEQEVSRRGGMVSEFSKAYRQENLSYGRVSGEMARVNKELTTPLMEAVAKLIKQGSYIEAVQRYMKAKHAAERNIEFTHNKIWAERLKELNEAAAKEKWDKNEYALELKEAKKLFEQEKDSFVIDNHSGIEQDDALGFIADFEAEFDTKELWEKKQALSDFVLDRWLQDGFIDRENYNFQKGRFKHYVPLRGFAEEDNTWEYQNKQMGKILNPNRKAEGRTSESEDPLQYLVNMAHSAIVLGEKNRIKQHIYRLVGENRDMEDLFSVAKVWHVATGEKDELGADIVEERYESPTAAEFESGMVVEIERNPKKYRIGKSKQEHAEHEVEVYINGRKHLVRFENPEVARAINKTNVADVPVILQHAGKATRWLTANFTAKNPAFIPINAIRDVSYSVLSHVIRGENSASFIRMLRRSQRAIKQFQKGKSTPDSELYKEFISQGGQTGFIHLKDVDTIKEEVEREIDRMTGDNNVWDKAMHSKFVGYWGEMMENWAVRSEDMCRFAAYMEARKNGKNNAEAAYAAKEVSVNFNRKGSHSNMVGSLFAFFNASVQGTENFSRLAWEHKGKMAGAAAGFAAMGFISALLQALHDDEEDKNSYRNLSPYIRRNYLTICYGKEDYISIPLPHGFRAFYGLGVLAAEMCYQEPEHALKGAVDLLAGAFSPVDIGAIMKENRKGQLVPSARPFIPTIAVPWFDLANNEDFAGRKIGREVYTKDQEEMMANAGLYQRNVNVLVKGMTDNVYTLFGGDTNIYTKGNIENGQLKRVPWAADWNPSKVEHVLTYYAGGRGKFFNDLMKTTLGVLDGAKNTIQGKDDAWAEFDVNNIPIMNRVHREGYGKNILGQYYRLKNDVEEYYGVLKLKPEWEQMPSPEMEIKKELVDDLSKQLKKLDDDIKEVPELAKELNKLKKDIVTQYLKSYDIKQ